MKTVQLEQTAEESLQKSLQAAADYKYALEDAKKNLEKSFKETSDYKYAIEESSIVSITNQQGIITHANENFCKISKYSREELIGQDHRIVNSGHHSKKFMGNHCQWKNLEMRIEK
jgi:PAS domain-containing protein